MRKRGRCPGCGRDRPLIGRLDGGTSICRECAGIAREFSCRHCGYEGELCTARTCLRCRLARKLDVLLDDGTGWPRAELRPLASYLLTEMDTRRALSRLRKPGMRELLADLATGRIALTHQVLAARQDWANALGFHQTTTTRQFTAAGGTWNRYAASRSASAPPARAELVP